MTSKYKQLLILNAKGHIQKIRILKKNIGQYREIYHGYVYNSPSVLVSFEPDKYEFLITRKNLQRSHHKQSVFVSLKPRIAIPVTFKLEFYKAGLEQVSPLPKYGDTDHEPDGKTIYLDKVFMTLRYPVISYGEYPERWRNGLLTSIIDGLHEKGWVFWRYDHSGNKIHVENPGKYRGTKVPARNVSELIEYLDAQLEKIWGDEKEDEGES